MLFYPSAMPAPISNPYSPLSHPILKAGFLVFGSIYLVFAKLPYCLLRYCIFPFTRKRKTWSFQQAFILEFFKSAFRVFDFVQLETGRNLDEIVASSTLQSTHAVKIPPVPQHYLQGVIVKAAEVLGKDFNLVSKHIAGPIGPRSLPAYWLDGRKTSETDSLAPLASDGLVILYAHGGGYKLGTAHESDPTTSMIPARLIQSKSVAMVLTFEYRLIDTATFPAQLIDALSAYYWLVNIEHVQADRVVFAGDSAGANLMLALTRYLRDQAIPELPLPRSLLLFSPWTDLSESHYSSTSSLIRNAHCDFLWKSLRWYPGQMIGTLPEEWLSDPYLSPATKIHRGNPLFDQFPPIMITVGEAEVFYDQVMTFYEILRKEKRDVNLLIQADAPHDVFIFKIWDQKQVNEWWAECYKWLDTFKSSDQADM